MKFVLALFVLVAACSARVLVKRADQSPKVFSALDVLRGGANKELSVDQIQELYLNVKPGEDFPLISQLPTDPFDCAQFKNPGFYADVDNGKCQIFHRCDVNGNHTAYLCPNMTMFNQITLVCDWWYNIDCSKAKDFYDYSNTRLYQDAQPFLDDENDYVMQATGAVASSAGADAGASGDKKASKKGGHKKSKKA